MGYFDLNCFENVASSILKAFANDQKLCKKINARLEEFKDNCNFQRVDYCIESFINSELDYETAGKKGIGRTTGVIPRLGAYFRESFETLSEEEFEELYYLIQDLILRGYLAAAFINPKNSKKTSIGKKNLFEYWVSDIYSTSPKKFSKDLKNTLFISCDSAIKSIKSFINEHNLKTKGLFKKNKINSILLYYVIAGYILRITEINHGQ